MKHKEMQRINTLAIFDSILNGNDTVEKISSDTDIGHATVEIVCGRFVNKSIVSTRKEKKNSAGRRKVHYSINFKYFCILVYEDIKSFELISINAENKAIDRDYILKKGTIESDFENLRKLVVAKSKDRYCRDVCIICSDNVGKILTKEFTRIKRNDFIINQMKTDNEIILFEIGKKRILSLFGKIIKTNATNEEIERVFKPDRVIRLKRGNWEDVFVALSIHTFKRMKAYISK